VHTARKVFETIPGKECVWTGKSLRRRFDVDHVVPHSIWRSNALWNLLPAAASVNRQKSDRLPTRNLLADRKSVITDYWDVLHRTHPRRFNREAAALAGSRDPDCDLLFAALLEAVEVTALQRGCERWEP